ncbi:hypothetical protein D0Y65_037972, partial [Glycine soja]
VKSAYQVIMEKIINTDHLKSDGDWQIIWKQKIPKWLPPPTGSLKCNVDASFFDLANCTGISARIRDSYGPFFMAENTTCLLFDQPSGEANTTVTIKQSNLPLRQANVVGS